MEKLGRKDHDALVLRFFENKTFAEVGTTLGASEDAAKTTVVEREAFGIRFQSEERFGVVSEEFVAQAGASFLIPIVGLAQIGLGLGADADDPAHRRDSRIWRNTSRQS